MATYSERPIGKKNKRTLKININLIQKRSFKYYMHYPGTVVGVWTPNHSNILNVVPIIDIINNTGSYFFQKK